MESISERERIVSRLKEIRQTFPNSKLQQKKQYTAEFKQLIHDLIAYVRTETNLTIVTELTKKIPNLKEQLANFKMQIQKQQQPINTQPTNIQPIKSVSNTQPPKKQAIKQPTKPTQFQQEVSQLDNEISQAIVREKPQVKWDDVAGLQQAKKVLQEAVILPIKFPQVFVGQRTPWKGILLYGPPGTGKTYLAKACATEMQGGTFFSVSASDLMSKYVGQSEKTIKALFRMARKEKPSIIFIDQIDSIAGQRSSQQNEVSRRVKTQFLIQMQGIGNDCTDVLVLGATNLPWALDSAVRRRFQKRVYIPLPDIKGRIAMLKKVIEKNKIQVNHQQLMELASMTQGYSGSDIASMANDALMAPVRVLDKTKKWIQVDDHGQIKYAPADPNSPIDPQQKYFQGSMQELKKKGFTLYLATKYQDFVNALKNSKPSVSEGDLSKYIDFTKTFGMDG